jgi:hypothetical protein
VFRLDKSKKKIDAEIHEALRERNVGLHVGKSRPQIMLIFRFHGRNYDIWYRDDEECDHRLEGYDYLYKCDQLESWFPQIKDAGAQDF